MLILCHVDHSKIFSSGVDSKYKQLAGEGLFKDEEFPPDLESLVGYGVNPKNGEALEGAKRV